MKTKTILLVMGMIMIGCNNPSAKTNAQDAETIDVMYETYYNERYQFCIDYPDFLIPQGESTSSDGQEFISDSGDLLMIVYRSFKIDYTTGQTLSLRKAFEEYTEGILRNDGMEILDKGLKDNYYNLSGKTETNNLFNTLTVQFNDNYYTIYMEYPESEVQFMEPVFKHVSKSLNFSDVYIGEDEGSNVHLFIFDFFNTFYWGKNFNTFLINNDSLLSEYIDSEMDVRRYYSPGAIPYLYTREENFGFDDYSDFESNPDTYGAYELIEIDEAFPLYEMDFTDNYNVYYKYVSSVPDIVIVNMHDFEMVPVSLPSYVSSIVVVFAPDIYTNPRAFYFVETPSGWKLAFVDDTLFSA